MDSRTGAGPLIVVVGPTACGKSALALELARRFDGEIICADSRTVYRGMDIGTAKPSVADRNSVPHHLLDVADPDQSFTAAAFKKLSLEAIDDISGRGKLPIMVGGTGLYVDAVLFDFHFVAPPDPRERARLQALSIEQLQAELRERRLPLPSNSQNPRHLIRALEIGDVPRTRGLLRPNTLILGLSCSRERLRERITGRVDDMLRQGLVTEVRQLGQKYGWTTAALQAPAYRAFRPYIEGAVSLAHAQNEFIKNDLQLAKRQQTWFKRNNSIQWFDNPSKAVDFVTTFLSKKHK